MTYYQQQIQWVQQALADMRPVETDELLLPRSPQGDLARQLAPDPDVVPREAAALLLFFPQDDELWLPLTVRSSTLPQHRGEVSLPGGAADEDDSGPPATALRETHEELAIHPTMIEIWGQLSPIYIPPSNFRLTPVVGFCATAPDMIPSPAEIAAVFIVTLRQLLDTATVVVEEWTLRGEQVQVPFFALNGYKVWGATALVLSELTARLRRLQTA